MSETDRYSPPADAQADLSERDRTEVDMAAERANLEAAILRLNTNYNPRWGSPPGKRLAKVNLTPQQMSWEPPQGCRRGSNPGSSSRRGPGSSAWSSPTAACWTKRKS